jgi:Xaa-Pro aminopeptidase
LSISSILSKEKLDCILLFNRDPAYDYFAKKETEAPILLVKKNKIIAYASHLEKIKSKKFSAFYFKNYKEDFSKLIKKERIKKVGFNKEKIGLKQLFFLKKNFSVSKDVSSKIKELREKKTKEELILIRKACKFTDEIFSEIVKKFNFKTEKEVEKFILKRIIDFECEPSFHPIVACEKNAAVPHHDNSGKLKNGFLVIDFGLRYKGYCSDMTRTLYLGKPKKDDKELFEKVLKINEECIKKLSAGLKTKEIHNHAIKLFEKDSKYFIHSLGHGVGVEVHEPPFLSVKSEEKLQKGNVVTIEPGYYNAAKKIGIRIEDMIFLGDKKEILTKSSKKLLSINFKS